jgi:hypothetical protein
MIPMLATAQVGVKYTTTKAGKKGTVKRLKHNKIVTYNYTKYQEIYDFHGTSDTALYYAVAFKDKATELKYIDTAINKKSYYRPVVDQVSGKQDRWYDTRTGTFIYYAIRPAFDPNAPVPYSAIVYTNNRPVLEQQMPPGYRQAAPLQQNPRANRVISTKKQ